MSLATDVEGIFRLAGSAKRIKELQTAFNSPERYGKGLDWTGYTVHDAANILRRYLNQLPEPIVPLEFYDRFRVPLRSHQVEAVGSNEAQLPDLGNFDHDGAVYTFQKLITELPPLNRQLLLYILDLLAVFSSKSDLNRMTSANLAAIFQPGIISHPMHDMEPQEYRLSQDVLIFLIENQDNFLIGMSGTDMDEKTIHDIKSGPPPSHSPKASSPKPIGRSSSNASAGADSLKRSGPRRNRSVSSRKSKGSTGTASPVTPGSGIPLVTTTSSSSGLGRSNTLPSKKSPALASARFQRPLDSPQSPRSPTTSHKAQDPPSATHGRSPTQQRPSSRQVSNAVSTRPEESSINNDGPAAQADEPTEKFPQTSPLTTNASQNATQPPPSRGRKISDFLAKSPLISPALGPDGKPRPSNRLQKKKPGIPGSMNGSAQSSQNSLHGDFSTPMLSPEMASHYRPDPFANPAIVNTSATPTIGTPTAEHPGGMRYSAPTSGVEASTTSNNLRSARSPEPSLHSRSSITDASDLDAIDDPNIRVERQERKHRWRFSSSAKRNGETPLAPPPPIGQLPGARGSNSSIGSSNRPRKSFTGDSQNTQQLGTDSASAGFMSVTGQSTNDSNETKEIATEEKKKEGRFGKWMAKMSGKDDKKDRDYEKDRAKSPRRSEVDHGSRPSLSVFAQDLTHRGRSMDKSREDLSRGDLESTRAGASVASSAHGNAVSPPTAAQAGLGPSTSDTRSSSSYSLVSAEEANLAHYQLPPVLPPQSSVPATMLHQTHPRQMSHLSQVESAIEEEEPALSLAGIPSVAAAPLVAPSSAPATEMIRPMTPELARETLHDSENISPGTNRNAAPGGYQQEVHAAADYRSGPAASVPESAVVNEQARNQKV